VLVFPRRVSINNVALRFKLVPELEISYRHIINVSKKLEIPVKFAGAGGSIVGTYKSLSDLELIKQEFTSNGYSVIIPELI